jgi:hypothetical protein
MYKILAIILLLSMMAGCSNTASQDPASPYFEIPLSTKISLLKSVTIPANTAHIFFQDGEIKSAQNTNQYHPSCRFEINKLSDTLQVIKPNPYTSKRIRSDFNVVSMPDIRLYYTEFMLFSDQDSNVRSLTCGQWSTVTDSSTYLTIKQMQQSVGRYMSIQLPETKTSH